MSYGDRQTSAALRGWVGLVSFLQLGVALAVILITYFKLSHISNFSVDASARTYNVTGTCLLNADTSKADMCIYAYTISGVSIIATLIVALFLCCTCDLCGCGAVLEFLFAGAGTAWWAIGAVVIMKRSFEADNANVAQHDWRMAEWIICWVGCGLFLLLALLSFARMIAGLCACCGGGNKRYP